MKIKMNLEKSKAEKISIAVFDALSLEAFRKGNFSIVSGVVSAIATNAFFAITAMYVLAFFYLLYFDPSTAHEAKELGKLLSFETINKFSQLNFSDAADLMKKILGIHALAVKEITLYNINPIVIIVAAYPFVVGLRILGMLIMGVANHLALNPSALTIAK